MKSPYTLSDKEREELILKYLPLVKSIAFRIKRHVPDSVDVRDLIGYGIIGLINAIDRLNRDKNFEGYLKIRIKGAIYDYLRSLDFGSRNVREKEKKIKKALEELSKKLGREPTDEEIARYLGEDAEQLRRDIYKISFSYLLNLDEVFSGEESRGYEEVISSDGESVEERVIKKDLWERLRKAIDSLSEREKLVIQLIFYEELSLKEVAQVLNCSVSRVSQIKGEAIEKLRKKLKL